MLARMLRMLLECSRNTANPQHCGSRENPMSRTSTLTFATLLALTAVGGTAVGDGNRYEIAAYYFPGYHPEPRNNARFGPGWTEWKLVQAAKPRFAGHRQPRVPVWGYREPDTTMRTEYLQAIRDVFPPPQPTTSGRRKPNVLFVISDDLNCRIGCYGDPLAKTPHIDRLASRGVRFERAYCQFPLCNPTRCSVLSGRYPTSTGVLDNNTLLLRDAHTEPLQDCFRRHGYAVAEHGKVWHGRNRGIRPGELKPQGDWSLPAERARQQIDEPDYWDTHHSPYRHRTIADPNRYAWANVYGPLKLGDRGRDAPTADRAIASLREFKSSDRPFFLAVGFRLPHVPLTAPPEFFDLYDPGKMPLPPDFANQPTLGPRMPRDELRVNLDLFAGRSFSETEAREAIRAYYACISYMDAQLGRVLDELERLGLHENTIIVFWGDHGWHLSEKGMWAKGTTFEVSAHGPLIIVDPRNKAVAGRASPRVVQYLDMYPTLVDLCGLNGPKTLEGHSLWPLLENPEAKWNHLAFTVQTRGWFIGRSVRTERWRYTEWDEGRRGAMLFDHDTDPREMRNLINDPRHAAVVKEMKNLLSDGPITPATGSESPAAAR